VQLVGTVLFILMLTTLFSERRPMPGKNSCVSLWRARHAAPPTRPHEQRPRSSRPGPAGQPCGLCRVPAP
jgi:hypothetical protein